MNSSALSPTEYNSYYQPYIAALGNSELLTTLKEGLDSFADFIEALPDEKLTYSYGTDKWSVAEVLIHLIDAERIFQYRSLRFARNDETPIPGFDQDLYVPNSRANSRSKTAIALEFKAVRASTIALFESLSKEELERSGIASNSEMSVRALGFIISGHLQHHKNILKERYL
ncbi:DinB family protein [uncultured Croceitalea sp.]|uniref:DinB family protein n=1 Tax=uncultured Croceitalea sp. TaxID=1798908 RepID=UPI0033068D5D